MSCPRCESILRQQMQFNIFTEKLIVREDPGSYSFINQGCLTVDNMDDKEEMRLTDVSPHPHSNHSNLPWKPIEFSMTTNIFYVLSKHGPKFV